MIDGLHFEIPSEAVTNSDILEFRSNGDRYRAKYNGLILDRYTQSCKVNGSIHKYFNCGLHNYNDFPLSNYVEALRDLSKTLNITPATIKVGRIEIGVNIDLDIDADVSEFLSCVFMLDYKTPEPLGQIGFVFKFKEYDFKIYAKELDRYKDRLRIELVIKHKSKRDAIIKEFAPYCNTLEDLANSNVWRAFGYELSKVFENIIIIDKEKIDYDSLTPKDVKLLINGMSPLYWGKRWSNRQTRNNHLNRFLEIIKAKGGNTIKEEIKAKIEAKVNELIDIENIPLYQQNKIKTRNNNFDDLYNREIYKGEKGNYEKGKNFDVLYRR